MAEKLLNWRRTTITNT